MLSEVRLQAITFRELDLTTFADRNGREIRLCVSGVSRSEYLEIDMSRTTLNQSTSGGGVERLLERSYLVWYRQR